MSVAADALFDIAASTAEYKPLTRQLDDEGVIVNDTIEPSVPVEVRVIPTDPKEIDVSEMSSTLKEFFSFYIFGSFTFKINDILAHAGFNHKIIKGWDRNANGGYTKIIAGRQSTVAYTKQIPPSFNTPYQDKLITIAGLDGVCYLVLNEADGSDILDFLSNIANGTYVATTLQNALSPSGTLCPLFDGITSYGQLPAVELDGLLDFDEYTISFWATRLTAWTISNSFLSIAMDDGNNNQNRILSGTFFAINAITSIIRRAAAQVFVTKAPVPEDDSFRHITITHSLSNDRLRLYEGGVLKDTKTGLSASNGTTFTDFFLATLNIGAPGLNLVNKLNGNLSDILIYNREATAPEAVQMATPGA